MKKEIEFINQVLATLIQDRRDLESRLKILDNNFNNPGWVSDRKYLSFEIGKAKSKIDQINYINFILKNRQKRLEEKYLKSVSESQVKM